LKVAIFFGSQSDTEKMRGAANCLKEFGIGYEAYVLSAHRVPEKLEEVLADVEKYAREILAKGAQNVIISMAGDGALLVTPEAAYFAKPIKGTVKNSVGAGDSMVAGFTGEFVKSKDAVEAFKWGVACGTATTFSDDLATAEFIKETYEKVEVEKR